MFPMIAELIKGSYAYPKPILILNKKTHTFWELGVRERLTELKVCVMHEIHDKIKKKSLHCITVLPGLQRLSSMLPCHTDARHPET